MFAQIMAQAAALIAAIIIIAKAIDIAVRHGGRSRRAKGE